MKTVVILKSWPEMKSVEKAQGNCEMTGSHFRHAFKNPITWFTAKSWLESNLLNKALVDCF